ncbi:hypothetical protein GGF31_000869 [Allomyces arbusculus]|nr:hypothetical protein GGF31_000869 [Allomyces arbusculus]
MDQRNQSYWTERVERQGLYPLINRGVLPRFVDFSPALANFHPKATPIHTDPAQGKNGTVGNKQDHAPLIPTTGIKSIACKRPRALSLVPKTPFPSVLDVTTDDHDQGNPEPGCDTRQELFISNGRIVENAALAQFLQGRSHAVLANAVTLIQFLERVCLLYAVDLIRIDGGTTLKLALGILPFKLSFAYCAPAIINATHVQALLAQPGRRFRGMDGHWAAIVKIQATWRMAQQRRVYSEMCVSKSAVRLILAFRRKCLTRAKFYEQVMKALESHVSRCALLRSHLVTNWKDHVKSSWLYHVHVPSSSLQERVRFMMKDVRQFESMHAGRLASAMADRTKVIYVTSTADDPLVELALRYLGRSTRFPRAASRCTIIYPECRTHVPRMSPLSIAMHASMAAQSTIRGIIAQDPGASPILHGYIMGHYDVRVASALNIPMLMLPLDQQVKYSTRPGFHEIMEATAARLGIKHDAFSAFSASGLSRTGAPSLRLPPGAATASATRHTLSHARGGPYTVSSAWPGRQPHLCHVTDEDTMWHTLAQFLLTYPAVNIWMLKIKDEAGRRGVALFHRRRLTFTVSKFDVDEIVVKIKAIPEAITYIGPPHATVGASAAQAGVPIALLGQEAAAVLGRRMSNVWGPNGPGQPNSTAASTRVGSAASQTGKPVGDSAPPPPAQLAYPTLAGFVSSFLKTGGTIEAMFDGLTAERLFVGCHVEIQPTGHVVLVSTWEQTPLVDFDYCVTIVPVRQISTQDLMTHVLHIVPSCIERGILGHVCFDFITYTDRDEVVLHCIDVKPYWSEHASLAGLCKIILDARLDFPVYHGMTGEPVAVATSPIKNQAPAPETCVQAVADSARALCHASRGFLTTDLSHLRPANLRMAGQAKWLNYELLNQEADRIVQDRKWNTGEEVRTAVIVSGIVHPAFPEVSHRSINAMLAVCGAEMDDMKRVGSLALGAPQKLLFTSDIHCTGAIQRAKEALAIFAYRMQGVSLTEHNCNFVALMDLLHRLDKRIRPMDAVDFPDLVTNYAATGTLAASTALAVPTAGVSATPLAPIASLGDALNTSTAVISTADLFAAPPLTTTDTVEPVLTDPLVRRVFRRVTLSDTLQRHLIGDVQKDPDAAPALTAQDAADMYQAALLAQEMYTLTVTARDFTSVATDMAAVNAQLSTELVAASSARRDRLRERRRQVNRSLKADRMAALSLAAGGVDVHGMDRDMQGVVDTGSGADTPIGPTISVVAEPRSPVADGGRVLSATGGLAAASSRSALPRAPSTVVLRSATASALRLARDERISRAFEDDTGTTKGDGDDDEDEDDDDEDDDADDGEFSLSYALAAMSAVSRVPSGNLGADKSPLQKNSALKIMHSMFQNIHNRH